MLAYDLSKLEAGFKNHPYNCKLLMFLSKLHYTYLASCTGLQVKLSLFNYNKTVQLFLTHLYRAGTKTYLLSFYAAQLRQTCRMALQSCSVSSLSLSDPTSTVWLVLNSDQPTYSTFILPVPKPILITVLHTFSRKPFKTLIFINFPREELS